MSLKSSLSSLENDLGCFSIPEVSDSEIAATAFVNGIVFVGHNNGCYSALGLAPGSHFQTLGVSTIESFGVPSGWQVIALAPGCTPDNPSTVQHEMLHALGMLSGLLAFKTLLKARFILSLQTENSSK